MKKLSVFLAAAMLICLLAACGSTQTDILYAVFYADEVKEYPIEYTGAQKTAEELAQSLSELTGLDFTITASQTEDGWIVDWAADSTLVAGLDDREQKEEFFFFDYDSQCWFMMDSLWRTLTENLDAENILSTAEMIKCAELNTFAFGSEDELIDTLYHDEYTTSENISHSVRFLPQCRPVITSVANLYLRKQIIFERM